MSKYTHTAVLSSHTEVTNVQEPTNTSSLLTGVITKILQSVPCLYEYRFIIIIIIIILSISLVCIILWHVDAWVWQYCVTVLYGNSKINQYNIGTHNHYDCQPLHFSAPKCSFQGVPKHVGVDNVS